MRPRSTRAAALYAAVGGALAKIDGAPLEAVIRYSASSFVIAAIVFWLIDRFQSLLLGTVVTIAGVIALMTFG